MLSGSIYHLALPDDVKTDEQNHHPYNHGRQTEKENTLSNTLVQLVHIYLVCGMLDCHAGAGVVHGDVECDHPAIHVPTLNHFHLFLILHQLSEISQPAG